MQRPAPSEYAEYYGLYINKVPEGDLLQIMEQTNKQTLALLNTLTEQQALHKYEFGKWSVKEIIQHLIDAERVFQYRAMRIARGDTTDLPGYDHNNYVHESKADYRKLQDLINEFSIVRKSTQSLFATMSNDRLIRSGTANNNKQTVRSLAYIVVGHEIHHMSVIKERYLNG